MKNKLRPALLGLLGLMAFPKMQLLAAEPASPMPVAKELFIGVNQSTVLENSVGVKRISIGNPEITEAVAVNRHEIVLNGKASGATTMMLWDMQGQRSAFQIHVGGANSKADLVREELRQELPGEDIKVDEAEDSVFLRGTVRDVNAADRAASIAGVLGKVVNLLHVKVPSADPQILLKVRFANVNRTQLSRFAFNLVSTGATNTVGAISTGQFGQQPTFDFTKNPLTTQFNDLLNVFLFRKDINLGATIQALQSKQLLQILAEPNLLTVSGRPASFLSGGEFPFPTLQGGGAGVGQITIQFREFGVRIHFLPTVTPRGTIRLEVAPEVSALDYTNGLTVGGYTVPGLTTRKVQTEVELQSGQSFVIAGLIDNRTTEILSKVPGLANIPLLGKLFESRNLQKNNSELMVLVTPELVDPIAAGAATPDVKMPQQFIKDVAKTAPQNPASKNQKLPEILTLPVEQMKYWMQPQIDGPPSMDAPGGFIGNATKSAPSSASSAPALATGFKPSR